jgi:hypothetical protein
MVDLEKNIAFFAQFFREKFAGYEKKCTFAVPIRKELI